ncbi:Wzz/FepE/Etk N-terminal domain-containing protein [Inquilinus sp. OTU3971]|uniref:Wzz/FepE/Etk N-terminal domain-containing protein n=1 Tax=Inquilinus sp. OTU3971 TaxID=3043855 RepID=UPI00313D7185
MTLASDHHRLSPVPSTADIAPDRQRTNETIAQDLIGSAWRHKWLVAFITVVAIGLGVAWVLVAPKRYTARLVIMPTEASQQLSDLVRNAGASVIANSFTSLTGNEQITYFDRFSKQLTSVNTASALKEHAGLIESLMNLRWNDQKRFWEADSFLTPVKAYFGLDTDVDTSAQAVAEFLRKNLNQEQDRDSPITTLSLDATDAEVARRTLGYLHQYSDDRIKQAIYQQTQNKLEYLQRRLQSVTVNDYRQTLIGLILDQEKILMLIQPNLPFAAEALEPPEVLSEPTSPRKARILAVAGLLGLVLGTFFAYRLDRRRRG